MDAMEEEDSSHGTTMLKQESYKAKNVKAIAGENAIKTELINNGPVHTGFTVYQDFMNYKSGIYKHVSGSSLGGHAVVIIGYGVSNGTKYWICQNSWGANWGEKGFFRIKIGDCGIDSNAAVGVPVPQSICKLKYIRVIMSG